MEQQALQFDRSRSIAERFTAFMDSCPDVYPMFVRIARDLRARGHEHYSADGIMHVIRWHRATSGTDAEGFKLNNVFSSRLARKAMEDYEDLRGFFETRELKAE